MKTLNIISAFIFTFWLAWLYIYVHQYSVSIPDPFGFIIELGSTIGAICSIGSVAIPKVGPTGFLKTVGVIGTSLALCASGIYYLEVGPFLKGDSIIVIILVTLFSLASGIKLAVEGVSFFTEKEPRNQRDASIA